MLFEAIALVPAAAVAPTEATSEIAVPHPVLVPASAPAPAETASTEISVLTYNIKGLPWPFATGRAHALKQIGRELATLRAEGRQPDIVLIQEGFRSEVANLVKISGYRYWAQGPSRSDRASDTPPVDGKSYQRIRYLTFGEGWGKFTSGGLHVLSDAPITDVADVAYRYCAGLDCLANKGAMLARIALPNVPAEIDVVNTHLNSRRASRTPRGRTMAAYSLQIEELQSFLGHHRDLKAVGGHRPEGRLCGTIAWRIGGPTRWSASSAARRRRRARARPRTRGPGSSRKTCRRSRARPRWTSGRSRSRRCSGPDRPASACRTMMAISCATG